SYPISPVDNADDARWQAFIGCWAPFTEDGHVPVGDHVVCIRPSRDGAVITTVDGDSVIGEQVIIPNERLRHVHGDECNGTERARWSNDGARIYTKEVLACGSDAIRRESIGAFSLAG